MRNISAHFVISTSTVPHIDDNNSFTIYPNPAKGEHITIQITAFDGWVNIEITDINGRLIIREKEQVHPGKGVQLPVASITNGIYLVSISSDNFNQYQTIVIGS